jgi:hypothetical protein
MVNLDLEEEQRSLNAINKLEAEYPYAASMLAYLVLELFLKLRLLRDRKTLDYPEVSLKTKVGPVRKELTFGDAKKLDDASFIDSFLVYCALGDLECIFKIPNDKRYSPDRNDVFHLNRYLASQLGSDRESLDAQNHAHLRTAKKHLVEASKSYFREWIIVEESDGRLRFES